MDKSPREPSPDRVALEMKLGFLEHTVDELNEVILGQAQALEQLTYRLEKLEQRLAAPDEPGDGKVDLEAERPPHY
jgi:uncharacterized coiled-coil protein SlyX